VAVRPSGVSFICHSKVSPGCKFKNSAIPSGIVALSDFDFGLAIEVFDLSGMVYFMFKAIFNSTYELAEELIYGCEHCVWQVETYGNTSLNSKTKGRNDSSRRYRTNQL
jgi:hypothetical protein